MFFLDGVSYAAVIAALLAMHLPPRAAPRRAAMWGEFREGVQYAFGFPPIRAILFLLALVSFMGMSYTSLMPMLADNLRARSPQVMGYLMASIGLGALSGALFLASRRTVVGLGKIIGGSTLCLGTSLVLFGLSHSLWLSLPLMVLTGFGMMVAMAASNTILQTIVTEEKRGRVMSLYTMAFMGMAPFGSLFAGAMGSWVGAQLTVQIAGVSCVLAGTVFLARISAMREHVYPIYRALGILPEVASGLEAATDLKGT